MIRCPELSIEQNRRDFNRVLARVGGKALDAGDVSGREAYKKGLTPEQLGAYHRAYFLWDKHEGGAGKILQTVSTGPDRLAQVQKGATQFLQDGKAILHLFETADVSTLIHEFGHILRRQLSAPDLAIAEKWAKVKEGEWDKRAEEKFARGFEAYVMEGVAPSSRLRAVFRKLKSWMMDIYKSIRNLKATLNDDIRAVFDRLLSTEEERRANVLYQMGDEYDAAPEGSLEAEALKRVGKEQADTESEIRATMEKSLRKQGNELYSQIDPFRVIEDLKIDGIKQSSLRGWDDATIKAFRKRWPGVIKKNGKWTPDDIAANYGYELGDHVMETLLKIPTKVEFVEKHIADGMRFYLDNMQMSEIERLAALVQAEIDIIKESEPGLAEMVTAAGGPGKNYSEALANRKPGPVDTDYENLKAAIRMAARSARSAYLAGKKEEALVQKVRQKDLLERLKARVADRQERKKLYGKINKIAQTATFTTKIEEEGEERRIQSEIPIEYRKQIAGILKSFGWKGFDRVKIEDREPLFDFLARKEEKDGEVYEAPFGALDEMRGQPDARLLTTNDLRTLHDCLNELLHKAKTSGVLQTRADRKAVSDAGMEMALRISKMHEPNLARGSAEALAPYDEQKKLIERVRERLRGWNIADLEVETLCEWLDGWTKKLGPNWTYLYKPINDATTRLYDLENDLKVFDEALAPFKTKIKGLGPWLNKKFSFPELGGKYLTKNQMMAFAYHYGNEGNRTALKSSFRVEDEKGIPQILNDEQVWAVISKLTPEEWRAVLAIVQIRNNPVRQGQLAETFLHNTGNEFKFVPLGKVTVPHVGEIDGWHASLIDDPEASYEMERRGAANEDRSLFSAQYRPKSPKSGFTIERKAGARHILDLDFIATAARSIMDQNRYVALTIPVRDVQKIINQPAFRGAVDTYLGKEYHRMLLPWLQDIARPQTQNISEPLRWLGKLRRNAVMVHIGLRVSTAIKHIPQLLMIAEAGSGPHVFKATLDPRMGVLTHPGRVRAFIESKSQYMAHVLETWDRDLSQFYKNFDPERWALKEDIIKVAMMPIDLTIGFLSRVGWMSEWNRAISEGVGEEAARERADKMVRDTVGSYDPKDLSQLRRGSELEKMLTMFTTVPAALYQRFFRMGAQLLGPEQGDFKERATRFFRSAVYIVVALGIVDEILSKRRMISGKEAATGTLEGLTNVLPIWRNVFASFFGGYPYEISPAGGGLEMLTRIGKEIAPGGVGGIKWNKFFEDGLSALGYFTGYPTDAIATAAEGIHNWGKPGYEPWNVLVKPPYEPHHRERGGMRMHFRFE